MSDEELTVSYSLKEILTDIKAELRAISTALLTKADKSDVLHLAGQLEAHDKRIANLEHSRTASKSIRENWKFVVTTAAALAVAAGTILAVFIR